MLGLYVHATRCPKNAFCTNNKATLCPNKLITRSKGAKSIIDCINDSGYYYRAVATTGQSKNPASAGTAAAALPVAATTFSTAAAATTAADVQNLPAAVPCPPDTYSEGLSYQVSCTQCPNGFHTDPSAPSGSLTSVEQCLAPPGSYVDAGQSTVLLCEAGTFSDTYNNDTGCTPCNDVIGPAGQPLGPGITTADAGANASTACRVLEPGFALVDAKGLVILQAVPPDQVRGLLQIHQV